MILSAAACVLGFLAILSQPLDSQTESSPGTTTAASSEKTKEASKIDFDLEKTGNVSAAIFDKEGDMVRELGRAEPMTSGRHELSWDGLDYDGKAVAPGEFEWRLLETRGLKSEYVMSVGTSIGPQEFWPGNHGGPQAIAAADDSLVIAAAAEGPPEVVRMSFDGKLLWERGGSADWTFSEPARGPLSIKVGGDKVYYLQNNSKVTVIDFATGKSIGKALQVLMPVKTFTFDGLKPDSAESVTFSFDLPNGQYFLRFDHGDATRATGEAEVVANGIEPGIARSSPEKWSYFKIPAAAAGTAQPLFLPQVYRNPREVEVKDGKLTIKFNPLPEKGKPVFWKVNAVEVFALPNHLAADDHQLVLASSGSGAITWVDPQTGAVLDKVAVPGVRDIALGPDGFLFALTADSIVSLSRQDKTPKARVPGLSDPVALSYDKIRNQFLVIVGGLDHQQVKRYDSGGKLLSTVGREGGRLAGLYHPGDFAGASDIASDGHGGFVVAEPFSAPRRVARFDGEGKVFKEWFGGNGFYSHTALDPLDPTVGWMKLQEDNPWVMQLKLDYDKRDWRPVATYRLDTFLGPGMVRQPMHGLGNICCLHEKHGPNGKSETLIFTQRFPGILFVLDQERQILRPLAIMGQVDPALFDPQNPVPVEKLPPVWVEAIRLAGGDPADVKSRIKYANYSWADENGDGLMQAKELQLASGISQPMACRWIDQDLALWQGAYHAELYGISRQFKPVRYTACGAPVWDLTKMEAGPKTPVLTNTEDIARSPKGDVYTLLDDGGDGMHGRGTYDTEVHGWGWPATIRNGAALIRLNSDGKTVWRSGPKAARWPHPRGQLMSPVHIDGFARGCVVVGDQVEQPCEFWTEDGLYVGGLFDGRNPWDGSLPGGSPDPLYTWHGIKAKRIGGNKFGEVSLFQADDMATGGSVGELPDGSVVFLGHGGNNNPCYRITGFTDWLHLKGSVLSPGTLKVAEAKGSGLSAEYYQSLDLTGQPLLKKIDGQVWFSQQKPWASEVPAGKGFSGRWSGFIEPKFTEAYTFSVYAGGEFKLWIDGSEVKWANEDYPGDKKVKKGHSVPIPLEAGKKVSVVLEYRETMPETGTGLHLNWESLSQPVEHVPQAYLYPAP